MIRSAVQIVGVNAVNKGAELMLVAIGERRRSTLRPYRLTLGMATAPPEVAARAGYHRLVGSTSRPALSALGRLLPARVRQQFCLVTESEVGAVLDASGYAYADSQSRARLRRYAPMFERWAGSGRAVVLLPQAFGPFEDPEAAALSRRILSAATLVFARDARSKDFVDALACRPPVPVAPDFTNLVAPVHLAEHGHLSGRPCLVPNVRMLDRTSPSAADAYRARLIEALALLRTGEQEPFILLHESGGDVELVRWLTATAGWTPEVVNHPDPVVIKGVLGRCSLVVASRFHAVVGALAQGVPTVVMGWSHKYAALVEDYGRTQDLVAVEDPDGLAERISSLLDSAYRAEVSRQIAVRSVVLHTSSEAMWTDVGQHLASHPGLMGDAKN